MYALQKGGLLWVSLFAFKKLFAVTQSANVQILPSPSNCQYRWTVRIFLTCSQCETLGRVWGQKSYPKQRRNLRRKCTWTSLPVTQLCMGLFVTLSFAVHCSVGPGLIHHRLYRQALWDVAGMEFLKFNALGMLFPWCCIPLVLWRWHVGILCTLGEPTEITWSFWSWLFFFLEFKAHQTSLRVAKQTKWFHQRHCSICYVILPFCLGVLS